MNILTERLFSVQQILARELVDQMNRSCFQESSNRMLVLLLILHALRAQRELF
jgi:hypothetical protein